MLFLQGQLGTPALLLSQRRGLVRGPASLLDQPLGPCPGSPGSVKNPGVQGLEMEDQVLQVNMGLPCPLKSSGALWAWGGQGIGACGGPAPAFPSQLLPVGQAGRKPGGGLYLAAFIGS